MSILQAANIMFLQKYAGQNYDDFGFDTAYFFELIKLMGTPENANLNDLEVDHFKIVSAYFQLLKLEERSISIEQENKALQKAQDHITALRLSLNELKFLGGADTRFFNELSSGTGSAFELNGVRLSDFAGTDKAFVFDEVTSLLYDLQLALEHSKIRRFKAPPKIESTLLIRMTAESPEEFVRRDIASAALESQEEDPKTRYQQLSKEYGKPRQQPLLGFLLELESLWSKYSPLPFSEGRYEPQARQYISRTVDTAQFCLQKMKRDYPYNTVAKKIRAVRESF